MGEVTNIMITLRYYQQESVEAVIDSLQEDKSNVPVVALETGTGKSFAIAKICQVLVSTWNAQILVFGPNEEIISQDEEALHQFLPPNLVGVYSASLNRKERRPVTIASIGSVHKKPTLFKNVNVIIVDECHLINHKKQGMYRNFIHEMPQARLVGFSATIYRLGHGYIHIGDEALFNKLVLDYTSKENFNKLVEDGYLATMISKPGGEVMDTSDLKTRMGDFIEKELSEKFDNEALNTRIVNDLIEKGKKYKTWLVFCIDIAHAEHINELLLEKGIKSAVVHSKVRKEVRRLIVKRFKAGQLQAVVNVNTLTTGLNVPAIDLIALLRSSKSPVFYKQVAGRGLRPFPGKEHCLFLDYAGVIPLLGPINDIKIHQKKKKKEGGEPVIKECPECNTFVAPAVRICPVCGFEFEFKVHLKHYPSSSDIVVKETKYWLDVNRVTYEIRNNPYNDRPAYLQVNYFTGPTGLQRFTEQVCLDHPGKIAYHASYWIKKRWSIQQTTHPPKTVQEAFEQSAQLTRPRRIYVDVSKKYNQVTDYDFNPVRVTAESYRSQLQYSN